ncbi:MAG: hypothetical protein HKP58_19795 [Desulfatitalea sp.]|nr:hypothetical protein [Desulfatitalea sp.]NNK02661.1 hypothetical protein [Desulfatitalea sp.]
MSNGKSTTRPAGEFRLSVVKTAADAEALSHLNKEEKQMAVNNLKKVPPSDGWYMMGNDPELQAFWAMMEREFTAFLHPDFQGIPFSPMNLMTIAIAKLTGSEYQYGLLATLTATQLPVYDKSDEAAKLAFLDDPDAKIWSEEEALSIKFAKACFERSWTDELFEQARAKWGEKMVLRYISWVGFVEMWAMLIEALGMNYMPEAMDSPPVPPAAVEHVTNMFKSMRPEMVKVWENLPEFGG